MELLHILEEGMRSSSVAVFQTSDQEEQLRVLLAALLLPTSSRVLADDSYIPS